MNAIKNALKDKEMTQGDLMRSLAIHGHIVSRSTVSNWCRGKRRPVEPVASTLRFILDIELEAGLPGRAPKCHEVYLVTSRRQGLQRSVRVRALSSAVLAGGMESGNRGNVASILVQSLKDAGRLAEWAIEAYSSYPEDIAYAWERAQRLRRELSLIED